ncbi:MAG: outer membrane protein assembly factor BamA, partial [Gemmatimonadota bacterium]
AQEEAPRPPGQDLSVSVDTIEVRGNERVPSDRILEQSGLRVGMDVSFPDVQDAIHRIFDLGEFSDVRILVGEGDPAPFHVVVEERPYVSAYRFRGLRSVGAGTVRDTVGLVDGEPLSPDKVARTMGVLRELLSNEGLPRARVDTSYSEADEEGYRLTFAVDEGPRLSLAGIEFEGNEAFSDSELRGAMGTGEEGFFWHQPGDLQRDRYERDLRERLPDFYARHGYIDMSVVDDTVMVDRTTGKGRVRIRVDEGPRYRIREFVVRGNRRFASDALRARYPEGSGLGDGGEADELPAFDQVAFRDGTTDVNEMYRNAGYLRARVIPSVERLPADSTVDGDRLIRATWTIEEGEPAYLRNVDIVGNDKTHDRIIRQRLGLLPGDVYSQERLVSSIRNVQSMGFFEQLPPQEAVNIEPLDDGDVDVTVRVKEKQTGNLNFGMSASAGTGFAGFVGYEQPNLFGQAKSGRFRWIFGARTQDIELRYSDPQLFGSRHSATVQLRNSRDEFRTFGVGERRQRGGSLEFGTPFPGLPSTRVFLGYSIFDERQSDLNLFGVDPAERGLLLDGTRSSVSLRVVRDTRQGGQFPVTGNRNMASVAFTGGPLGGDGSFGKYEFESEWFVPVAELGGGFESNPVQFIAGLDFRGGFILGENPFPRERFFMGGTQIGRELRGYQEATVTPQGHVPDNTRGFTDVDRFGGSYFATTARFGAKISQQIAVNAFADAGNVWSSATQINPTDLLVGAGAGVSLVTPFGPLGIDYAYGFDRRDALGRPDPGWQLHFKFGRIF